MFLILRNISIKLITFFLLINCSGGGSGSTVNNVLTNNNTSEQENISSDLDSTLNEIFSLFNELGL